jgi:aromatic-amino-acid transaminase
VLADRGMEFLIPSRLGRPSDDPIFALNTEAKARAAKGEKVVNATVGALLDDDGKLAVLDGIAAALREVSPREAAGYAPIAGSAAFLKGVANDLLGDRVAGDLTAAVATPGGTGALRHAIASFLEPGQAVLTTSFFWGPYKTLADENGRTLRTFRQFDEGGALDLVDLDRQLAAILKEQGRALVLVNSPCHNPTGYSFDANEWRRFGDIVAERSSAGPITLCLDVAYAKFGDAPLDLAVDEMLRLPASVLPTFAWSASKSFLQYGLRVGALVAAHRDAELVGRVQNALSYACRGTWSNVNAGGMIAIGKVLGDASQRAAIDGERAKWASVLKGRVAKWNALAKPAGLRYPRYDGGFFTTVFTERAHEIGEALKQDGVFVVPQEGALRVALCSVAERDIELLVSAIAKRIEA